MATSKTIKSSGGDYTTLAAWEAAINGDLTGTGVAEAVCYSLTDTASIWVYGWTTTASDYIYIRTDASARHAGVWDAAKYNRVVSNTDEVLFLQEDYIRIDGLQVSCPGQNGNSQSPIIVAGVAAANDIRISNCILKGSGSVDYIQQAIALTDADIIAYIWNCIMYGIDPTGATGSRVLWANCATAAVYSCTGIGGAVGLYAAAGVVTAKNDYFGGSKSYDYDYLGGTLNETTCASSDTTGSAAALRGILVSTTADSTHAGFVDIGAGTEDFHIKVGSPLIGVGTDTSGDAAPMNFTTDIDGDSRS